MIYPLFTKNLVASLERKLLKKHYILSQPIWICKLTLSKKNWKYVGESRLLSMGMLVERIELMPLTYLQDNSGNAYIIRLKYKQEFQINNLHLTYKINHARQKVNFRKLITCSHAASQMPLLSFLTFLS